MRSDARSKGLIVCRRALKFFGLNLSMFRSLVLLLSKLRTRAKGLIQQAALKSKF
ncbi:hypothetical protein ALQ75_200137 [Pseudomonas savastanoi pv. glycinea]|nr:hypothetical protein ALQ75_200137 [Pseudomonas savastanoi pv. glycinea]